MGTGRAAGEMIIVTAVALVFAFFSNWLGNRQFAGYDLSVVIDVAWRQFLGQKPYADFVCTLPVGFYLLAKYAFVVLGVSWDSLVTINSCLVLVTFVWSYLLLNHLLRKMWLSLLVVMTIQSLTLLLTSFLWHSTITSVVACIYLLSAVNLLVLPERKIFNASYVTSLSLLALMKPNVAFPLVLLTTFVLVAPRRHRFRIVALTLASALIAYLVLASNDLDVPGILQSYAGIASNRGFPNKFFVGAGPGEQIFIACLYALLSVLTALAWRFHAQYVKSSFLADRKYLILLVAILVGLYGCGTNWEFKVVDFPPIICALALTLKFQQAGQSGEAPSGHEARKLGKANRILFAWTCIFLLATGLFFSHTRARVVKIGIHGDATLSERQAPLPFFRTLKGPNALIDLLEEVAALPGVSRVGGRGVFFGPGMEFCYATFGIPSPTGLPVWWHPGSSYALGDEAAIIEEWKMKSFDLLIFQRDIGFGGDDFTRMPHQALRTLASDYDRQELESISVYTRKR